MLRAMPQAMLNGCSKQSTQRTQQTDATYVTKTFKKILAFRIAQTLWKEGER